MLKKKVRTDKIKFQQECGTNRTLIKLFWDCSLVKQFYKKILASFWSSKTCIYFMTKKNKNVCPQKYPETATKPNIHQREQTNEIYLYKVYLHNGYYLAIKSMNYQYMQQHGWSHWH